MSYSGAVSSDDVLHALMKHSDYANQPEAVLAAMQPFMGAAPEVLAHLLSEPFTLETLAAAKRDFAKYLKNNGFVPAVVAAMPEEDLGFFGRDYVEALLEEALTQIIEVFSEIASDSEAFLETPGVDEKDLMASPDGAGLTQELLAKYRMGTLTVGEVLATQPAVIVKNTN